MCKNQEETASSLGCKKYDGGAGQDLENNKGASDKDNAASFVLIGI